MLFLILLLLSAILATVLYIERSGHYWKKRNIVQENGTFWKFVLGNVSLAEIYKKIYDRYRNEPHVGIFIGGKPGLLLRDVENIQAILAGDFHSFHGRGITINPREILADNVLFLDDYRRWKILRHIMSPVFTSMKLKNMFHIIDRCAQDFVMRVKENPKFFKNPYDALLTYTTSVTTASVFGIDAQIKNTMDSPLLNMARNTFKFTLRARFAGTLGRIFPHYWLYLNMKLFDTYKDFFIETMSNVMERRKNDGDKRHDFIDLCVKLEKQSLFKDPLTGYELKATVEVLAAQAFFFFAGGTGTSSNTMHFILLELSSNPKILAKVHKEIDQVFDSCDEKITYNEIEKLQYLDMVINEAMRKYPPIGVIQRKCNKTTVLPVGSVKIEKDCFIIVPILAIHRDERYYPNPEVFDPERFSTKNISNIPKYTYLSFGEGNRMCTGARYARLLIKAALAWLLRTYTLEHQSYKPKSFEASFFAVKDTKARYNLIQRSS